MKLSKLEIKLLEKILLQASVEKQKSLSIELEEFIAEGYTSQEIQEAMQKITSLRREELEPLLARQRIN